jgi:hypothetical protein
MRRHLLAALAAIVPAACGSGGGSSNPDGPDGGTFSQTWDFTADAEGWTGAFCDYPQNEGTGYELMFGWASLSTELGGGGGLRISGNNHSDDLFMYVTRSITGLRPSTAYAVSTAVRVATNASADCVGIGGGPGTDVTMKIGAAALAPLAQPDAQGWLRLNLDKGDQSTGGADLKVAGDISNGLPCDPASAPYELKNLALPGGFTVTSSSDGTVFVILGTDSGFEGVTTLYYDQVSVTLTPAN